MLIFYLKGGPPKRCALSCCVSLYLRLWISIWIHSRTLCFTCPRSMLQVLHRATFCNNFWMCPLFFHSATFLWDLFSHRNLRKMLYSKRFQPSVCTLVDLNYFNLEFLRYFSLKVTFKSPLKMKVVLYFSTKFFEHFPLPDKLMHILLGILIWWSINLSGNFLKVIQSRKSSENVVG